MDRCKTPSSTAKARARWRLYSCLLGGVILLAPIFAEAHEAPIETPPAPPERAQVEVPTFEITFGNSKLFYAAEGGASQIPVSSALLLFEYFLTPRWHLVSCLNLPLGSARTVLVDGTIKDEYAPASTLLGLVGTVARWDIRRNSRLEIQLGALAGRVLVSDGRYFPLTVARVHILQNQGFGLYIGTAFAFRVDTLALIYGAGHRF